MPNTTFFKTVLNVTDRDISKLSHQEMAAFLVNHQFNNNIMTALDVHISQNPLFLIDMAIASAKAAEDILRSNLAKKLTKGQLARIIVKHEAALDPYNDLKTGNAHLYFEDLNKKLKFANTSIEDLLKETGPKELLMQSQTFVNYAKTKNIVLPPPPKRATTVNTPTPAQIQAEQAKTAAAIATEQKRLTDDVILSFEENEQATARSHTLRQEYKAILNTLATAAVKKGKMMEYAKSINDDHDVTMLGYVDNNIEWALNSIFKAINTSIHPLPASMQDLYRTKPTIYKRPSEHFKEAQKHAADAAKIVSECSVSISAHEKRMQLEATREEEMAKEKYANNICSYATLYEYAFKGIKYNVMGKTLAQAYEDLIYTSSSSGILGRSLRELKFFEDLASSLGFDQDKDAEKYNPGIKARLAYKIANDTNIPQDKRDDIVAAIQRGYDQGVKSKEAYNKRQSDFWDSYFRSGSYT